MKTTFLLLATLIVASTAHAQVFIPFSAEDGAPTDQGFTRAGTSSSTPAADTYLGENVWVVEDDAENEIGYRYEHALSDGEIATLQSRGYRIHARVAFLETTYNDTVSSYLYLDNGVRKFRLWLDLTDSDEFQLLHNNSGPAINLGSANPHGFYNIAIDVAPGGASAEVLVNGEVRQTGWTGEPTDNTKSLRFGNASTGGRGKAAWNRVQIASRVPASDMTFVYHSGSDSYELDAVNDVAGHLHIPDTFDDGTNGEKAVTEIGSYACAPGFVGHTDLVGLRLPSSLTKISISVFRDCSGFKGSLSLSDSLTEIGNNGFDGCSGFTGSLTLPNSLTEIDSYAFRECSGFKGSLTIPAGVTSIGSNAFAGCSGFSGSLTLPESLTEIGIYAFHKCYGFTGSLTIPASVTSIGNSAFRECSGLDEVCWLGAPPPPTATDLSSSPPPSTMYRQNISPNTRHSMGSPVRRLNRAHIPPYSQSAPMETSSPLPIWRIAATAINPRSLPI